MATLKSIKRSLLAAIFIVAGVMNANGQKFVRLDRTMGIEVPENYQIIETEGNVLTMVKKDNPTKQYAIIKTVNTNDFDENLVFAKLDTIVFRLNNFKQIDTKQEPMLDLSHNYFIKKYVNTTDTLQKVATYTFYSYIRPYSMLMPYSSEEEYSDFVDLYSRIEKAEVGGWRQLFVFWKFGKGVMLLILALSLFLPILLKKIIGMDMAGLITLIISGGLIIYTMWGYPVSIVIMLIVSCFIILYAANKSFGDIFE